MKRFLVAIVAILMTASVCLGQNERVKASLEQQYSSVDYRSECNQYVVTNENSKQGVCDADGKVILNPVYDRVGIIKSTCNTYFVKMNEKWGCCDNKGNEIIAPTKYTKVTYYKEVDLYKVNVGDKVGYCDGKGNEIIAPTKYTDIRYYKDEDMYKVKVGDKFGYCDSKGNEIIAPTKYTDIWYFKDADVYWTQIGDKHGCCDGKGNEIIAPTKYTHILYYFDMYRVQVGDKVGYCDGKGNEIIAPTKYTDVRYQEDADMYVVYVGDKTGCCDGKGNEIIAPTKYTDIWYNKRADMYKVRVGDKVGYCDSKGNEIMAPTKYTDIWYNKDADMYMVNVGDKVGYCDSKGHEIIAPTKYTDIWYQEDADMYMVNVGDKTGYCDGKGNEIIAPNKYTNIYYKMASDLYEVKIGDQVGYCNNEGKELVPPKYGNVLACTDGEITYFIIKNNGKSGLLDSAGKTIVEPKYESLFASNEELCGAKWQGKWGYISVKNGSVMVPFEYDEVSDFKDGVAKVVKNGQPILLPNPTKAVAQDTNQPKVKGKAVSTFPAPDSDVDKDIPMGKKADNNTHAFIIANENYPVAKVPYALNDGWMFEQYCKKALGIKEGNVHLYEDATGGNIMACVEEMKQTAKAANGQATIIFYYAGHAFPDEDKNTAYLLPVDGDSKNPSTGYSLERLYKEMNSVQAKQMVCFLDACFSGATRDDQMLITGRGVTIKVKDEIPQGNMVVMTSATGAETAHSYEEMHHGLFTYYLLQKLQETQGDVTLGDLSEYVTKMVKRKSVLINQKKQTPTVIPSPKLQATWQEMKLQ